MLSHDEQARLVFEANLAPSVHNTQPTRWRFEPNGVISLYADTSRFLSVGDPSLQDAGLSSGAALEGTIMSLAKCGIAVGDVEDHWHTNSPSTLDGFRLAARIHPAKKNKSLLSKNPLDKAVQARFTWRSHFLDVEQIMSKRLEKWANEKADITLVTSSIDLDFLAVINDTASLSFMRNTEFRNELLSWMRLSNSDPKFSTDGLNLHALKMNALEGFGAKIVLGSGLFRVIDQIGLAKSLVGETAQTKSSSAIALFHRPQDESPIVTGRTFYRFWLEVAALGFAAWPMAAVADNIECASECKERFNVPEDHRLVNVLRLGRAGAERPSPARLKSQSLII